MAGMTLIGTSGVTIGIGTATTTGTTTIMTVITIATNFFGLISTSYEGRRLPSFFSTQSTNAAFQLSMNSSVRVEFYRALNNYVRKRDPAMKRLAFILL